MRRDAQLQAAVWRASHADAQLAQLNQLIALNRDALRRRAGARRADGWRSNPIGRAPRIGSARSPGRGPALTLTNVIIRPASLRLGEFETTRSRGAGEARGEFNWGTISRLPMHKVGLERLRPVGLIEMAIRTSRRQFVEALARDKLLLVKLTNQPESLATTLTECPTDSSQTWYPRSETTGTGTAISTDLSLEEIAQRAADAPPPFDGYALSRILDAPHFVVPLRKRECSDDRDEERVTVGRSHSNDIVLFHKSISKSHAWLEHDDRRLYVCDRGSTNFTHVGGRMIQAEELVQFSPGDPVRFGDVVVRVCEAETLWDALNNGGAQPR